VINVLLFTSKLQEHRTVATQDLFGEELLGKMSQRDLSDLSVRHLPPFADFEENPLRMGCSGRYSILDATFGKKNMW